MHPLLRKIHAAAFRRGALEARTLFSLLAVVLGAWLFLHVGSEMREGDTQGFDEWAIRSLRQPDNPAQPIGPFWLPEAARDITGLGGAFNLALVSLIVAGFLCLRRKFHAVGFLFISLLGGLLLNLALKRFFHRPRPAVVPHLTSFDSASFPSGHSMLSAIAYLTLGVMLARLVDDRAAKLYFLSAAVLLAFLVGMSRIYLGVHYPTDVLAGWLAGITWAILCSLAARRLQREGVIEPPAPLPAAPPAGAR